MRSSYNNGDDAEELPLLQSICSACRERNIDCVYGTEASKGRPRGPLSKAASSGRIPTQKTFSKTQANAIIAGASAPDAGRASSTSPISFDARRGSDGASQRQPPLSADGTIQESIADDLHQMFVENFVNHDGTRVNVYQEALAAFNRKLSREPLSYMQSVLGFSVENLRERVLMSYDGLLCLLAQELVEMLSLRFGSLGCLHLEDPRVRFYVIALARDHTPSMFDPTGSETSPLHDFDSHRTVQMIDVWFSVHPLSTIVSKTLLLRSYRCNQHDELLLAVILADACHAHNDQAAQNREEALFQWAASRLRTRPMTSWDLPTAQVLMLLGWHELCLSRARRGTCYLGYAGRIITRLNASLAKNPLIGLTRINGIDIGEVEAELIRNIYWITFAITLWSFMQMDQPFSDLLPATIPTTFPPVDESASAVIRLDVASDNVATRQAQARMIRELWPLSHITSTTAHIYALYPRTKAVVDAPLSVSWQARPLHQLRRLFSLQDISVLCDNVRRVLSEAIDLLESKVENAWSQALVLTAYHTMIVHMLFPRQESSGDPVVISQPLLDEFCNSARALLNIFSVIDGSRDADRLIAGSQTSTAAATFMLGLDVCGRALNYFYARCLEGSEQEFRIISNRINELATFASEMHQVAKAEMMQPAKRTRTVKKTLKHAKRCLEQIGSIYESSGSMTMDDDGLTSQASHSGGSSSLTRSPPSSRNFGHAFSPLPTGLDGLAPDELEGIYQGLIDQAVLPTGYSDGSPDFLVMAASSALDEKPVPAFDGLPSPSDQTNLLVGHGHVSHARPARMMPDGRQRSVSESHRTRSMEAFLSDMQQPRPGITRMHTHAGFVMPADDPILSLKAEPNIDPFRPEMTRFDSCSSCVLSSDGTASETAEAQQYDMGMEVDLFPLSDANRMSDTIADEGQANEQVGQYSVPMGGHLEFDCGTPFSFS
ncbi:MAG: hypothetical protein M1817_000836 [Caeruleum heppii]|nr:MAG: hypothetical protein M1817_000836 [Caeruleum heppii]